MVRVLEKSQHAILKLQPLVVRAVSCLGYTGSDLGADLFGGPPLLYSTHALKMDFGIG